MAHSSLKYKCEKCHGGHTISLKKIQDISGQFSSYGQFIRTQKQKFQDIYRIYFYAKRSSWLKKILNFTPWESMQMKDFNHFNGINPAGVQPHLKSGHFVTFLRKFRTFQDKSGLWPP